MRTIYGTAAISEAFGFLAPGWRTAWGALLLCMIANVSLQILPGSPFTLPAIVQLRATTIDNISGFGLSFGLVLVSAAANVMAYGALYRASLDQQAENGPFGLQWRAAEWRVLGAILLLALMAIPALLVAVFALSGFGFGLRPGFAPTAGSMLARTLLFLLVDLPLMIWALVRLSPFLAATVDQRRVVVIGAWKLTQGAFWSIFWASAVVAIADIFLGLVVNAAAGALGRTLGQVLQIAGHPILPALFAAFAGVALFPARVGLYASIYRQTRPPTPRVADVFN